MESLTPIFAITFFFSTIGIILGSTILTRHKERMVMIEKGLKAEDIKSLYERQMMKVNPLQSLKWGIVLACVGMAIMLGVWLRGAYSVDEGIFPGLIAAFGGVALVIFYFIARKQPQA